MYTDYTFMGCFQLQTRCIEGLNQLNSISNCIDDPNWISEERDDGMVYTCSNIGAQVSCYDRDSVGREGWDRCLESVVIVRMFK